MTSRRSGPKGPRPKRVGPKKAGPKRAAARRGGPSVARSAPGDPRTPDRAVLAVRGAREHNLKNVDVTLPRDSLVVITGLSGYGKSSLAFDTI